MVKNTALERTCLFLLGDSVLEGPMVRQLSRVGQVILTQPLDSVGKGPVSTTSEVGVDLLYRQLLSVTRG